LCIRDRVTKSPGAGRLDIAHAPTRAASTLVSTPGVSTFLGEDYGRTDSLRYRGKPEGRERVAHGASRGERRVRAGDIGDSLARRHG
jgi:hypothetical protein